MAEKSVLLDHNIPVYEALEKMLQDHSKAIIVTAQGTGKSYLTLEYLNKHDYNALVVCPKRSICAQWEKLSGRITTITYQKLCRGANVDGYDCYIFDEAHHCGSSVWGRATKTLMNSTDKPVIGLTADSVRYLDGARDVAFDVWDGCVVYGATPQEAIETGILPSATYICALYDAGEKIKKYRGLPVSQKLMARLEYSVRNCSSIIDILHRHMPDGVRKGIVFVDSIDAVKDGIRLIRDAFPGMPVTSIHSKWTQIENSDILDAYIKAESGYIVAVDMLNEGVHIPGVNTIIMLRKTVSPNVFMQQLGRGLAAGVDDIIVFDFVGNNCCLKIGKRSEGLKKALGKTKIVRHSDQFVVKDYASEVLIILKEIDQWLNGRWTQDEENILRIYYPSEGPNVYRRLPGRTKSACQLKAFKLGFRGIFRIKRAWTPEEDEIIKKYYPSEGTKVCERLPGRAKASCHARAAKFGVTQDISLTQWKPEEDAIIRKFYPAEGKNVVRRLPLRTQKACVMRASTLKVPLNCNSNDWTTEEDKILQTFYSQEGGSVSARLPGRTAGACRTRARRFGLIAPRLPRVNPNAWTAEEDEILRTFYPEEGCSVSARLPGRTTRACRARFGRLGLKVPRSEDKNL